MRSLVGTLLNAAPSTKTPVPIVSRAASAFSGWRYNRGATQALGAMEAASVVFGIVDRLATSVSLVDWKLWKKAPSGLPEDRVEVTSHLALDILNSPNEFYSRAELMEAAQQHQELTGESWLVVSRNPRARSIPLELWPVRPDRMEPVPSAEAYIAGYEYRAPDGECVPLKKDEILFVRRPDPNNPYRGLGPIRSTLTDIDSIRFSMEWNKNFFVNGAEPGGIVEIDRRLSDDEFDELVERWREQHQGTSNAHRVAILEQVKWVDRKYTMRDMQFTELRGVTEAGIKLAFGFPKFALGEVDDVNRAQGEASIAMYAKWLVVPRLERWKGVFNRRFLPMFGTTASGLEFDYVNPVSEDTETENASRTSRVQAVASLVPLGYDAKKALEVFGLPDIPFEKPEPPAPAPGQLPPGGKPGKKQDPLQALLAPTRIVNHPGHPDQSVHGRRTRRVALGARVSQLSGAELATARDIIQNFTPKTFGSSSDALHYLMDQSPKLPKRQQLAVERYSGEGLNFEVNRALGAGETEVSSQKGAVASLREAARPLPDDVVVARVFPKDQFDQLGWGSLDDIRELKGKKVRHAAFASTSLASAADGTTYGLRVNPDITMRIAAPAGTPGIMMPKYSLNPGENEIVLHDGMDFAVASVEPNGVGGFVLHMIALPLESGDPLKALLMSPFTNQAPTDDPELEQVQEDWEEALAALLVAYGSVSAAQQAALVAGAAAAAGDVAALAALTAPTAAAASVIAQAMQALGLVSGGRMAAVLASQGAPSVAAVAAPTEQTAATAEATASLLASGLSQVASRAAVAAYRPGVAPAEVASAVQSAMDGLSERALRDQLGGALTRAQNEARLLTARAVEVAAGGDPGVPGDTPPVVFDDGYIPQVIYSSSEVNDKNTCPPCHDVDGEVYESWIHAWVDYGGGKYRGCLGRDRCRGTVKATWNPAAG